MNGNSSDDDDSTRRPSAIVDSSHTREDGPDRRRTGFLSHRDSQIALISERPSLVTMPSPTSSDNEKTRYRSAEEVLAKLGM